MKKKLITFLLLCSLCLAMCACNIIVPNKVNPNDSTQNDVLPPTDNTTPSNSMPNDSTENTDNLQDETCIEYPLLTLSSKDAYTEFLSSVELPDNFVSHDKIDAIGAFEGLVFLTNAYLGDYSQYMYTLVDSEGYVLAFRVDHRDQVFSTESSVSNITKTNMRLLSNESKGSYVSDAIVYKYLSGKLYSISWKTKNITYQFNVIGKHMLSDYPLTDSTFVGKMLNTETAPQALNDVFNMPMEDPLT